MTTYKTTLEEVSSLASQGKVLPVYREVHADLDTPVSWFHTIDLCHPHCRLGVVGGAEGGVSGAASAKPEPATP